MAISALKRIAAHFRAGQIARAADKRPLILQIETTNICNARCVFCAYGKMKRKPEVLGLGAFEKAVREYSGIGGGAVSFTPIMGDPLLDPYMVKRYEILDKYKNINRISFTTNGIAFAKYSDNELEYILKKSFMVQFSVGGLDREMYKSLYGVDELDNVLSSLLRILEIKKKAGLRVYIYLTFRTNDPDFEKTHSEKLGAFRQRGVFLSHTSSYMNYGGRVAGKGLKNIRVVEGGPSGKRAACALPLIGIAVCSNGRVTCCGCVDIEGEGLAIGDVNRNTISECWRGEKRTAILKSFPVGKPPELCRRCSAYKPNAYLFSGEAFKNFRSYREMPIKFYLRFFGA